MKALLVVCYLNSMGVLMTPPEPVAKPFPSFGACEAFAFANKGKALDAMAVSNPLITQVVTRCIGILEDTE